MPPHPPQTVYLFAVVFALALLCAMACDRGTRAPAGAEDVPDPEASAPAASAAPQVAPATTLRTEEGRDGATLIHIPGGQHAFGGPNLPAPEDALAPTTVTLAPFWIDRDPVSAGHYAACVRAGACAAPVEPEIYARLVCSYYSRFSHDRPMNCISRENAAAYCAAQGRRLPSEWEWEAAARHLDPERFLAAGDAGRAGDVGSREDAGRAAGAADAAGQGGRRAASGPEEGESGEDWVDRLVREAPPAPPTGAPDFSLPPGAPPPLPAIGSALGDAPEEQRSGWLGGVSEWTAGVFDGGSNQRIGLRGGPRAPVRGRGHELDPAHATLHVRWGEVPERAQRGIGFRCAADDPPPLCEAAEGCAPDPAPVPAAGRPEVLPVPAGAVHVRIPRHPLREVERGEKTFEVEAFGIDALPVSAAAYENCIAAGACPAPGSVQRLGAACTPGQQGLETHPATCLTAAQAEAYCGWIGATLPTELQWLRAAWGEGRARQPWGEEEGTTPRANRSRADASAQEDPDGWFWTSPAGAFPEDRSPFGVLDVGGNVSEWVRAPVDPYLFPPEVENAMDLRRRIRALVEREGALPEHQVLGASWDHPPTMDGRDYVIHARRDSIGFRCAWPAP